MATKLPAVLAASKTFVGRRGEEASNQLALVLYMSGQLESACKVCIDARDQCLARHDPQMLAQLTKLNDNYPGGLSAYLRSARTLLSQAVKGENPLAGWSPSVPDDGFDLAPGTDAYKAFEEKGLAEAAGLAFAVPGASPDSPSFGATGDTIGLFLQIRKTQAK